VAATRSRERKQGGTKATGDAGRDDAPALAQHEFPWPIVRVRKRPTHFRLDRRGKEVVMIRPDGISLLSTRGPVTDEMLQSEGEVQAGTAWTNVPSAAIREIRVKRVGFITASSWWNRFEVVTDRKTRRFRIPDREVPHVVQALREVAGDRFREAPSRRLSAGEFAMIGIGIVALLQVALGWAYFGPRFGGFGFLLLFFAGLFPLATLWEKRRSEYQPPRPPRKKRRRASGRRPFRSPVLGWSLKAIGLGYILFIFFSDIPSRVVDQKNPNYSGVGLVYLPGIAALALGSRLCIRTFEPRRHPDPRRPVLFLRAFDDDGQRTFQPTSWLAVFHGIFSYAKMLKSNLFAVSIHPTKLVKTLLNVETYSAEELLASGFRRCGPFVAIGRPGERLATSGADRMYVLDAEWQKVVLDYLGTSQAVILQPANTDGVQWEIEQVFARVPRDVVLLSMLNFKDRPNLYEEFRAWIAREHGIHLAVDLPFQDTPSFVYFEGDGSPRYQPLCYRSPLTWSFVGNAVDTESTFHTFIQGLDGEQREEPRTPNRYFGDGPMSVVLVGILVFGLSLWWGWVVGELRRRVPVASDRVVDPPRIETKVSSDIAQRELARSQNEAIERVLALRQRTSYRGRAIPYEFRLDPEWKTDEAPSQQANLEHSLVFRDGIGQVRVIAGAGGPWLDFYSDALPESLRGGVETAIHEKTPGATVQLLGSRWVVLNGVQWREIVLERRSGQASDMERILCYSSPSGWISVTIVLPNLDHYRTLADEIASTFKAPESDLDQLLREAREGKPAVYRGKRARYSYRLRPIWKPQDLVKEVDKLGDAKEALKEMGVERVEYTFNLGDGRFGRVDAEVDDEAIDFGDFKGHAKQVLQALQQGLEAVAPGFQIRVGSEDPEILKRDGLTWGELRFRVSMTKDDQRSEFQIIYRVTTHRGKSFAFSGQVHCNHPGVEALVREALDSVRFDD